MGLTAPSRVLVRKSKKSFGQKQPCREAATWSVGASVSDGERGEEEGRRTGGGCQEDEARPVVFDQFAHAEQQQ